MYDSLGQVTATYRASGVLVTVGADPAAGGIAGLYATTLADAGTQVSESQTWYDDQGRTVETRDAAGLRAGTVYNPDGSVAAAGVLAAAAPDGGHVSTANGVTTVAYTTADFLADPATGRGEYTYTLSGQVDTSTGQPWSGFTYDDAVANDGRDASGNPAASHTRTYASGDGLTTFTVYADGSYAETVASVGDQAIGDYAAYVAGSPVTPPVPAGGSETVTLAQHKPGVTNVPYTVDVSDAAGNLVDVYEPAVPDGLNGGTLTSPHTHYDYDAGGNEVGQVDATGGAGEAAQFNGGRTTWTYDADGHELSRTLPDGEVEHYTYDARGDVATHVDFDGNTATDTYDTSGPHAGQLQKVAYTPYAGAPSTDVAETVTYTYDGQNRPLTVSNPIEATAANPTGTTTDSYDAYGNLAQEQTPEGTVWHVYDPATGHETDTYTDYTETQYGYDAQGRLTTVTQVKLNGQAVELVTTYTYDGLGDKATETLPNGDVTTYTYDAMNRLTKQKTVNGTTTVFNEQFTLNSDGSRASAAEVQLQGDNATTVTTTYIWTYDADGRLQKESAASTEADQTYSDAYQYDLNGNQTQDLRTGTSPERGAAGTTAYTYNGDDELQRSISTAAGETDYAYDLNGSQTISTAGGVTTAYGYDVRNKLVAVKVNGNTTAALAYDDAGDRVRETAGGTTTTYYLTDTANPTGYAQAVEQRSSPTGAPTLTYLIGDHVYGQAAPSGTPAYYLTDGHGSTVALTDATGRPTQALAYTAYGDPLNFSTVTVGGAAVEHLFGGDAMYDSATKFYLNGDGTRGRFNFHFLQADEEGNGDKEIPVSLNRYDYGNSNSIEYSDPSGHLGLSDLLTVVGIAALVLTFTNVANAPFPGGPTYKDTSGDMAVAAVLSPIIVPPIAKLLGFIGGLAGTLLARAIQAQGTNAVRLIANQEADELLISQQFGRGTVFSHFTDATSLSRITGLPVSDVESMSIGQNAVIDSGRVVFKPGIGPSYNPAGGGYNAGGSYFTDLPADATDNQLSQIGVRAGQRDYVVRFSQESAVHSEAKIGLVKPNIYVAEGQAVPVDGTILIQRVR